VRDAIGTRGLAVGTVLVAVILSLLSGLPSDVKAQPLTQLDLVVAVTTSTQDSGLMDLLVPLFEKRSGYRAKTISGGTGQTLTMGSRGDAEVVLGHAPELERKYVDEGALVNRRLVMYNDFVIVGPPSDPARIKGMRRLAEAFHRIAESGAPFVSRADESGTHIREKMIWERAGRRPAGSAYIQTGQGQGATLLVASEKRAYALTDRGTHLAFRGRLELDIVFEKAPLLRNIYHVMQANPARHPRLNHQGGRAFSDFLVSPVAQEVIRTYGVAKYGEPLFFPAAGRREEELIGRDQ
jgi:tungstate transport system substrate-binding protein